MSTPADIPDEVVENPVKVENNARAQPKSRLNRKALIALVAVVGGVAVSFAAYGVYLLAVSEPVSDAWQWVLATAGLASLPIAALIAALAFALILKRSWFRHYNLWTLAGIDSAHVIVLYFLLSRRAVPTSMQARTQVAFA